MPKQEPQPQSPDQDKAPALDDMRTDEQKKPRHPWHQAILDRTPASIINNSSNVIGAMHVGAEFMMLKAAGIKFLKNNRGGDKVNFLIDPPNNLWRGLTGADKDKALQNQWSTRSTMSGFSSWVLGSLLPEGKDEDKGINLDELSAPSYTAHRLKQAVQLGNPDTKRQQIGLGVTAAGIFSAISGFNNVNLKTGARFVNWSHAAGGVITALSGSQLLFGQSDREAWQGFGSTIWLRLPLAGMSTYNKFVKHDRWGAYLAGQIGFQSAALYSYLYGGLEKLPDGRVVDHEHMENLRDREKDRQKESPLAFRSELPVPLVRDAKLMDTPEFSSPDASRISR